MKVRVTDIRITTQHENGNRYDKYISIDRSVKEILLKLEWEE